MSRVHLAIIGGGLVGASLALALQAGAKARGWKIVLIEPFAPGNTYQPSYDARSSALSYGARLIYERLGVWESIVERGEPIKDIHVSDRGRFSTARLSASDEGVPALGYVVENAWLGQCLWKSLDPDVISWRCPAEVIHMQALEDGYRLTLNDETTLDCDLAVLADGGRSGLREQLGIQVRKRPYDQSALIANITTSQPHDGMAFERFTDEGPMALLPLPDNRCALVWTRLGSLDLAEDVIELGRVIAVQGRHALLQGFIVFGQQLLGSIFAEHRTRQGLPVVFYRVARVVVGIIGRMGSAGDQRQGQENRFHCGFLIHRWGGFWLKRRPKNSRAA